MWGIFLCPCIILLIEVIYMILNLTQHTATPAQVAEGVVAVAYPNRLNELLTVDPDDLASLDQQEIHALLATRAETIVKEFVVPLIVTPMSAMIGGAPFLMEHLVKELYMHGVVPVYALSRRVSKDVIGQDGTVTKVAEFQHLGWINAKVP